MVQPDLVQTLVDLNGHEREYWVHKGTDGHLRAYKNYLNIPKSLFTALPFLKGWIMGKGAAVDLTAAQKDIAKKTTFDPDHPVNPRLAKALATFYSLVRNSDMSESDKCEFLNVQIKENCTSFERSATIIFDNERAARLEANSLRMSLLGCAGITIKTQQKPGRTMKEKLVIEKKFIARSDEIGRVLDKIDQLLLDTWTKEVSKRFEEEKIVIVPGEKEVGGRTPLHLACLAGDIETIRKITTDDPEAVWKQDNYGNTPLHTLVSGASWNNESLKILLDGAARAATAERPLRYLLDLENHRKETVLDRLGGWEGTEAQLRHKAGGNVWVQAWRDAVSELTRRGAACHPRHIERCREFLRAVKWEPPKLTEPDALGRLKEARQSKTLDVFARDFDGDLFSAIVSMDTLMAIFPEAEDTYGIREGFKALVLLTHPDKQAGDTDSEKTELATFLTRLNNQRKACRYADDVGAPFNVAKKSSAIR